MEIRFDVLCVVHDYIIYPKGLLEAAVVSNVFTLGQSAIYGQLNLVQSVIRVLIHDTLGGLAKFLNGTIVPPLLQIAMLVKLSSCHFQLIMYPTWVVNCGILPLSSKPCVIS